MHFVVLWKKIKRKNNIVLQYCLRFFTIDKILSYFPFSFFVKDFFSCNLKKIEIEISAFFRIVLDFLWMGNYFKCFPLGFFLLDFSIRGPKVGSYLKTVPSNRIMNLETLIFLANLRIEFLKLTPQNASKIKITCKSMHFNLKQDWL